MKDLILLTDRYPFNNSEAFIENEIDIMASYFDRVFILPCGLMVDTKSCRKVPNNVKVIMPPVQDDIWMTRPSVIKKMTWALLHLTPWFLMCLITCRFYIELVNLNKEAGFSFRGLIKIFRVLGPALRNSIYYRNRLKSENIENAIVYSYWLESSVLFADKIVGMKTIRKKICRTHRWDLYASESNIGYLPFQRQVIDYLDQVFVISDNGLAYLNKCYPEYSKKFSVSRLGTKDYGLNPYEEETNEFVIVSCSFVHKVKRVNLIVDALSKLNNGNTSIKWIHFGGGQDLNTIEHYASEHLGGMVKYDFKGQVSNTYIINYYKSNHIDLFLNVSSSEGIPVSIMEATSFSLPVVATDVGGTCEIVVDDRNGMLLPKDFQVDELAKIIELLINDKSLLDRFRDGSRIIWEKNYSCEANYNDFYSNLIGS